jgi:hypothetical protein
MFYEPYHTPSWDTEKSVDHYEGKKYNCDYCGTELNDHEVFLVSGKSMCGCCK